MSYSDLTVETLIPEPVAVVTCPDHPFTSRASVSFSDFGDQDLITTPASCTYRDMLDEFLSQTQTRPRSIIETNNIQAIIHFVMSGLGISILPRVSAENEIAQDCLLRSLERFSYACIYANCLS
jgi:DNA-binding transcriptional LysR family regulator